MKKGQLCSRKQLKVFLPYAPKQLSKHVGFNIESVRLFIRIFSDADALARLWGLNKRAPKKTEKRSRMFNARRSFIFLLSWVAVSGILPHLSSDRANRTETFCDYYFCNPVTMPWVLIILVAVLLKPDPQPKNISARVLQQGTEKNLQHYVADLGT